MNKAHVALSNVSVELYSLCYNLKVSKFQMARIKANASICLFKYPSQDFHSQIYIIYPTYYIIFKQLFSGKIHILFEIINLHSFYHLRKKLNIRCLTEEKVCLALLYGKSLAYLYGRAGEECDFQKRHGLYLRHEQHTGMRCRESSDDIGFLPDEQSRTLYRPWRRR